MVDYYLDGDTMIVASITTPGTSYIVTSTSCSCPAGMQELPCKHAAYRMAILLPRRPRQTEQDYVNVCAAANELC